MSAHLPVRGRVRFRRHRTRRASGRFDLGRILAGVVMVAAAGAIFGVSTAAELRITATTVAGSRLTTTAAVDAALDLGDPAPNALTVRTDDLRARLEQLPGVESAEVDVVLPGTIEVRLAEREPVLAWKTASGIYLVDRTGYVIADAGAADATADAKAAAAALPVVVDHRFDAAVATTTGAANSAGSATGAFNAVPVRAVTSPAPSAKTATRPAASAKPAASPKASKPAGSKTSTGSKPTASPKPAASRAPSPAPSVSPAPGGSRVYGPSDGSNDPAAATTAGVDGTGPRPGSTIAPLDFDVATRLLSLRPVDVGSASNGLKVTVDEASGWTVRPAKGEGWVAVFGLYADELRDPNVIPEQVRLLRSVLLSTKDAANRLIVLADGTHGTMLAP